MRGKILVLALLLSVGFGMRSSASLALAQLAQDVGPSYERSMTTIQYNNARTGWNANEVVLNIENVSPATFGKKWASPALNGQIYAAPLYVRGVMIDGTSHNVVYVATETNWVYALDAADGQPLWPMPYLLGTPAAQSMLDRSTIGPMVGITSTPVINLETGTLYAVGMTNDNGTLAFKMAALDIATGESRAGWPITIMPPASSLLNPVTTGSHGALLLANGKVYVPFGSQGDSRLYYGWVVAIDPENPTTPPLFYRTPGMDNHTGSGIWSYGGIAADENGYIYGATGDSFNVPGLDYSNAVLRLDANLAFSESPADFFAPSNWRTLDTRDLDLGSSTPLLLPPQAGSLTPNMIFIAGKFGVGHLLDRDNLGGVGTGDGTMGEGIFSAKVFGSAFTTAVYYEDPNYGPLMFLTGRGAQPDCGISNGVVALALDQDANGNNAYHAFWCTPSLGNLVSTPVVTSALGETGIMWVVNSSQGVLYAFNAATGEMLYNSSMVAGDALGGARKFQYITVIDGQVFAANSANNIVAYGLR